MSWFAGDFPSWIAALLAVVAIVLARRALAPPSYMEFHREWEVTLLNNGHSAVKGRITGISHAVYFNATGTLRLCGGRWGYVFSRWHAYPLKLIDRSLDAQWNNATIVTLEAEGFSGEDLMSAPRPPRMKLDILRAI